MPSTGFVRQAERGTIVLPPLRAPSVADEANHRIANSLQLLSAMVASDSRGIKDGDAKAALDRTLARIQAIAGVHRQLHLENDTITVDMHCYLADLVEQLSRTCPGHRHLLLSADAMRVPAATASSFGILISELVINACKLAHPADGPGDVAIALTAIGGGYSLVVEDRGCGGPPAVHRTGLGQRLIHSIVGQLDARMAWEDARPGTRFRMDGDIAWQ